MSWGGGGGACPHPSARCAGGALPVPVHGGVRVSPQGLPPGAILGLRDLSKPPTPNPPPTPPPSPNTSNRPPSLPAIPPAPPPPSPSPLLHPSLPKPTRSRNPGVTGGRYRNRAVLPARRRAEPPQRSRSGAQRSGTGTGTGPGPRGRCPVGATMLSRLGALLQQAVETVSGEEGGGGGGTVGPGTRRGAGGGWVSVHPLTLASVCAAGTQRGPAGSLHRALEGYHRLLSGGHG